jgi:hypothetical protein
MAGPEAIRRVAGLVIWLACALAPLPVAAQEFGVYRSSAQSGLYELGAPSGLGAYARMVARPWLSVRISYHRFGDSSQRVGEACNNVAIYYACSPEQIDTESTVHGGAAVLAWRLQPTRLVELDLGGGLSVNDVRASDRTATGRPSTLFYHNSAQGGVLATAHGRLQPIPALPVVVDVGLANHLLLLRACAEDTRRYDPFCGAKSVRELRVGLGFAW